MLCGWRPTEHKQPQSHRTLALSKVLNLLLRATRELSRVLSFIPAHNRGKGVGALSILTYAIYFKSDENKKPKSG